MQGVNHFTFRLISLHSCGLLSSIVIIVGGILWSDNFKIKKLTLTRFFAWDAIDPFHKSHDALQKYPKMHHFVTEISTRANFCYKMMHCGIWDWCIVGFMPQIYGIYGFTWHKNMDIFWIFCIFFSLQLRKRRRPPRGDEALWLARVRRR